MCVPKKSGIKERTLASMMMVEKRKLEELSNALPGKTCMQTQEIECFYWLKNSMQISRREEIIMCLYEWHNLMSGSLMRPTNAR